MGEQPPVDNCDTKVGLELTDGVILLRPFRPEDAPQHLAGEDGEQVKWLSGGVSTLEGVEKWIQDNDEHWRNSDPVYNFVIENLEDSQLVGMVEARDHETSRSKQLQEGDANISYGLYPEARGKGFATRSVELVTKFLQEKGFKRAIIQVRPENEDSLRVPTRLGFTEVGVVETKPGEKYIVFAKNLI